jgi:hypothetical protein
LWVILRTFLWRQHGWTYRRIADALALNHTTVIRWMPEPHSGGASAPPEQPARVTGHDSYGAGEDSRENNHDDCVLAVAMACWYGEHFLGEDESDEVIDSMNAELRY